MTKTRSTKQALLMSVLALVMCLSMLVGSTMAWFTDSVTSTGNIITAGTLDVEMYWADGTEDPASASWLDASHGAIFNNDKWEPGYTEVRHIKIENKGSLALKYQIKIAANGLVSDLAEVIDVYYADPAVQVADRSALAFATVLGTLNKVLVDIDTSAAGELPAGESHVVTIALKMQESAGNEYQDKSIGTDFSVQLVATQDTVETDSFGDQYDADSEYPLVVSGKKALNEELTLDYGETNVQIVVPADAYAGGYTKVVNYESLTEENGKYTYAVDFAAELDGEEADPAFDYEVNLKLPQFVNVEKIIHNGNEIPLDECTYDAFTGVVTFYTNSFSPFEVTYTEVAEQPKTEGRTLTGGNFVVDPVEFDETLDDENSKYIAVEYIKDGVTNYMVCERATTIIVGDADDEGGNYLTEDKNYTVTLLSNNQLHSAAVNVLNKMDYGTLLILPGTYKEQARLQPTTNMDIIGLGNAEDIKLIKVSTTSTSSSHQHLINCNGDGAEYIQVTIRNLYLDSTANNGSGFSRKDNGAVQAIRKAMVKCYDLIINDTGFALYLNATNAVDGVLSSAYMYVENTVISGNSVLTYSGSKTEGENLAYFTHYGLTYSNGAKAYTVNETLSGRDGICHVSNEKMDYTDWDW